MNGDGVTNVTDVQLEVNLALGINPCTNLPERARSSRFNAWLMPR